MKKLTSDPPTNNDVAATAPAAPSTAACDPCSMPPPSVYPYYDPLRRAPQKAHDEFGYSPDKVYGMKRRFSLTGLLVMVVAASLVLTLLKALNASLLGSAVAFGLIAVTALGQAFLFAGQRPRLASIIAGGVYSLMSSVAIPLIERPTYAMAHSSIWAAESVCFPLFGMLFGWLAGEFLITVAVATDVVELCVSSRRRASPTDDEP
jgi:hypothetical protein